MIRSLRRTRNIITALICVVGGLGVGMSACNDEPGSIPGVDSGATDQIISDVTGVPGDSMVGTGDSAGTKDDSGTTVSPAARLQSKDLIYQGAFLLPEAFNYGARGLSFHPTFNNGAEVLFVTGHDAMPGEFGVVSIPEPTKATSADQLSAATLVKAPVSFDGTLIDDALDAETSYCSGIEYVAKTGNQTTDKLYGSVDWWYAVGDQTYSTVWFSELDGSTPQGLFHVGANSLPFHGNKMGDFLFTVPQWYATAYLGGRTLVTGKTRGAFGGSQGPTLFAFHPTTEDAPVSKTLDALPMLWYREKSPDCAGPNVGDKTKCDFPNFTMCDKWLGASFVENATKRAIVLAGVKGLGDNSYGQPSANDCDIYQGYHCDPFQRQMLFYDADEIAEVATGKRDAWTVVPYETWVPPQLYMNDGKAQSCGETGGMAFDPQTKRIFFIEKGYGGDNGAIVHVWTIP
jgi:hypothetical protein